MAPYWLPEEPYWPCGTNTQIGADLVMFPLYVSKALFHPVFDHIVFPGDSDTNWQKCLEFSTGIGNWCMKFC